MILSALNLEITDNLTSSLSIDFNLSILFKMEINSTSSPTKKPLTPLSKISFVPPGALKAITGVPTVQLSNNALGKPTTKDP